MRPEVDVARLAHELQKGRWANSGYTTTKEVEMEK